MKKIIAMAFAMACLGASVEAKITLNDEEDRNSPRLAIHQIQTIHDNLQDRALIFLSPRTLIDMKENAQPFTPRSFNAQVGEAIQQHQRETEEARRQNIRQQREAGRATLEPMDDIIEDLRGLFVERRPRAAIIFYYAPVA